MATISPEISRTIAGIPRVIWEELATGDTVNPLPIREQWGLAASVQISGTFGGATVVLQHSNDGVTWFTASDLRGAEVSFTAAGIAEISLSSAYIRPGISGGTGDDIDVVVVLRGLY
jgi:hypothetical protein